jgi:FkbM family methyltransferase
MGKFYIWNDIFDGNNTLRLDYPLNEDSIVFDVGAYKGEFIEKIYSKYKCNIYAFEPIPDFFNLLCDKFAENNKIHLYNFGLHNKEELVPIQLKDDSSSIFRVDLESAFYVEMKKLSGFFKENEITKIDLLKLNVEGAEYYILDDIIKNNLQLVIDNIQVQFHHIDKKFDKYKDKFCNALSETHQLTYKIDWIWENWQIKTIPFYHDFELLNKLIDDYLRLEREHEILSQDFVKLREKQHNLKHAVDTYISTEGTNISNLKHQMELNK